MQHQVPSFEGDLWLFNVADPNINIQLTFTHDWEFTPSFTADDTRIFYNVELNNGANKWPLLSVDTLGLNDEQPESDDNKFRYVRLRRDFTP